MGPPVLDDVTGEPVEEGKRVISRLPAAEGSLGSGKKFRALKSGQPSGEDGGVAIRRR